MSQVSPYLRRAQAGYTHWCPACGEMHRLPDRWKFNGDVMAPTFTPSFKHTGRQPFIVDGRWTGDWVLDEHGKAKDWCCHYILTAGQLHFCGDCTHAMVGQTVPLPEIPSHMTDED